jgi:hypothetical protein
MGLYVVLWGQLNFLYVDDARTSQETLLLASTTCYGNSFTFKNNNYSCNIVNWIIFASM